MRTWEDGEKAGRLGARGADAPGIDGALRASTYQVRVVYTEPEFQRRTPGAPREYSFTYFGIVARSPQEAVQIALRDFRETARRSRVSWRRCVERVTVMAGSGAPSERQGDDLSRDV